MAKARFAYAIEVQAPQERVFGYVADWANAFRYVPGLADLRPIGLKRYGLGTRLRGQIRLPGLSLEAESEVVEFTPPRRIAARSVGGVAHRASWAFAPSPRGTLVTAMVEYELQGFLLGPLAGPLVRHWLEDDLRRSLEKLAKLLESEE